MSYFKDIGPFKSDNLSLDARIRRLYRELQSIFARPIIPQRGSNSNGEWIRFADGTQICTYIGFAGVYQPTWIYPQPFITTPVVHCQLANVASPAWVHVVNVFSVNAIQAQMTKLYWSGTTFGPATNETVHCMAIGQWF